jgi:ATP-dependent Lon protease
MLWTLGIPSHISPKIVKNKTYWRLIIVGGEKAKGFQEIIDIMVYSNKKERFKLRLGDAKGRNSSRFGNYINFKNKVLSIWKNAQPIKDSDKKIKWLHTTNNSYSCTVFKKVLETVGNNCDSSLREELLNVYTKTIPLEITNIENSECEVCDVVVPENATFVANGIISHNTSFAKSIALALGRESSRISLGGVRDEAELRGHRRTYVGAMPGKIMQGMRQVGVVNPVFILDEIDKLGNDYRGDPSSALLEILDPEQNHAFKDHYINLDYDLSKVMFIATANNLATIPAPLRDRMEVIDISGYCEEEKIEIAKKFIIPKKIAESGLLPTDIYFSKEMIKSIIRSYTKEFGVRDLARQVFKVCRKVSKLKALNELTEPIKLNTEKLFKFLGPEKFNATEDNKNGIGVVTGLAWTPYGGELLKIEAISIEDETGDPILTGQLGSVMQESAKTALSLIKSNAAKWKIEKKFLKNKIHIHAPAGATPKDGPSAGIALVSCLISLFTQKKIKDSIAMTGEITLTGKVLPIGGVREKILAAIRSNIKLVILPKENEKDYLDFVELIGEKIKVKYVSHISEVLKEIF